MFHVESSKMSANANVHHIGIPGFSNPCTAVASSVCRVLDPQIVSDIIPNTLLFLCRSAFVFNCRQRAVTPRSGRPLAWSRVGVRVIVEVRVRVGLG